MTWTEKDVERFMSYVEVLSFGGCWYWTGARSKGKGNKKWYGSFHVGGKTVRAHRFSVTAIGRKEFSEGCHRDHICNFSMCVNPDHIEIVTREENEKRRRERKSKGVV